MPLVDEDGFRRLLYGGREPRFDRMARDAGHTIFGDITSWLLIQRALFKQLMTEDIGRFGRLFRDNQQQVFGSFTIPILLKPKRFYTTDYA